MGNGAVKMREDAEGAPFRIGDRVRVVQIIDNTAVQSYLGECGRVEYLEYSCGCGQAHPQDPMIGVRLEGETAEFWPEELLGEDAPHA